MNTIKVNLSQEIITDELIQKLTSKECNGFGLPGVGVYTYKGQLKTRVKGFKKVLAEELKTVFECENYLIEIHTLVKQEKQEQNDYAMRLYDKATKKYEICWPILWGVDFLK